MNRVFVLGKDGKALMPCSPARARKLLSLKKAKVERLYPFTIRLTVRETGNIQPVELKYDPGSKQTGIGADVPAGSVKPDTVRPVFLTVLKENRKDGLPLRCKAVAIIS